MTTDVFAPASTCIAQAVYDDETELCIVTLTDGSTWNYLLPQNVMDAWREASSAGAFYNLQIRRNFAFFA